VTGAVTLKSNITLQIEAGAVLLGSERIEDFPVIEGRWEGVERKHHASLINGEGLENIAIVGRGTLDGRGRVWWEARDRLEHPRGRLIGLYRCRNVRITGVTLTNSPAWTVNPVYCENVTVDGVTIINPPDSPNTDGINPDSSRNVRIANCHIDVGDDCITIKSGRDEDGRRVGRPCENITITNCTMIHGHGGVVIGSEMSGGVNNVVISNCVFDGTDNGIRMKTMRGRGGVVQDIRVSNIVMRNVGRAIKLNMHYHRTDPEPVSERTPAFRNIHISGITVRGAKEAGYFRGLEEMPLEKISLSNAIMYTEKGISCTSARNLAFHNVEVQTKEGSALDCIDVEDLEVDGFKSRAPHDDAPVIRLEQVQQVLVRGCRALPGTSVFLELAGNRTDGVRMLGNALGSAAEAVRFSGDVDRDVVKHE
jgi:polygalacturonase